MNKFKRNEFLKIGGMAMLAPLVSQSLFAANKNEIKRLADDDIMERLLAANEKQTVLLLESVKPGNLSFTRKTGYDIATLSASYCYARSKYYHDNLLIPKIDLLVDFLETAQTEDGTLNFGNLESPPDTAFLIEILGAAATVLQRDNSKELAGINSRLKKIMIKASDALSIGGIHTPNHRWVISAALAQVNALFPDKKYINRINEWLSEGVYQDKDGHFPERSGTYSAVETTAFISIARLANKPVLFDSVRKNLNMYFYYIEPNGELVSNDSRRQDQYAPRSAALFYMQYRYMAIRDNNPHFAAITKMLESAILFDFEVLSRSLFYFLENETLQKSLPVSDSLPDSYEKLFTTSQLLRIKRKNITTTLFGGVDWPMIIASGRSCSPNFFSYRKGKAILKYMRLSSDFFSMGYFYSEGIKKESNKYILSKKLTVPYYQPLPKDKRNSNGDYKLTPSIDDRFWNKMDFKNRPVSNVKTLDTVITFTENNGSVELDIDIKGLKGVPVTIELCFAEGGKLSGVSAPENDNYFLEGGTGKYEMNGDTINFGPGSINSKRVDNLEGEKYSTHFGSLRTKGIHVYLTGVTPFAHKLKFS